MCDEEINYQNALIANEPHQSMLSECEYLEENVGRLNKINDENSCFGIVSQCHLTLMRNEKQVDWEKEVIECNELMDENEKKEKEMKQMAKMHD